jgi:hypothetical protein
MFATILHNSIRTIRPAAASDVALIYWVARRKSDAFLYVVSKIRASVAPAACIPFFETVSAFTANDWIGIQVNAITRHIVIDVKEVLHNTMKITSNLNNHLLTTSMQGYDNNQPFAKTEAVTLKNRWSSLKVISVIRTCQ